MAAVMVVVASAYGSPALAASGTIRWLVGREPVGQPVPHSLLQGQSVKVKFVYERLITFDAAAGLKMVVSLREGSAPFGTPALLPKQQAQPSSKWICFSAWAPLSTGTGCQLASNLFAGGPLNFGFGGVTGDPSVHGLASDAVGRITLSFASGRQVNVPLRDNAFLVRTRLTDSPTFITAYNSSGKAVAHERV